MRRRLLLGPGGALRFHRGPSRDAAAAALHLTLERLLGPPPERR